MESSLSKSSFEKTGVGVGVKVGVGVGVKVGAGVGVKVGEGMGDGVDSGEAAVFEAHSSTFDCASKVELHPDKPKQIIIAAIPAPDTDFNTRYG